MSGSMWQDNYNAYEEKKSWWSSRPVLLIGAALAVIIALGILWHILSPLDSGSEGDIPYIMANPNPEKVKPENPGGEEFPHQDKKIYDLIDGDNGKIANTMAAVENADQQIEMPITDVPASFSEASALTPEPEEGKTVYNIQGGTVNVTEINDNDGVDNKKAVVQEIAEVATEKPKKASKISGSSYRLQVASLPTEEDARKEVKILNQRFKMLRPYTLNVVEAQVNDKTMHRIYAGPFESKDKAESLCQDLQNAGGSCLVVKPSKS